jgi:hypothetical protein
MRLHIPLRVRSGNVGHGREHWAARARRVKRERQAVALAWPQHWPRAGGRLLPDFPVAVMLTRIAPRAIDTDNLLASLKAVRDEVARILGVDDRDPRIRWGYHQTRGGVREYAVAIELGAAS